jgi:predicted GIY-YIG superfamily endonuclease
MVYIIHIAEKIGRCQHYIGYTKDLERRIKEHQGKNGSPLLNEANKRGIKWEVVVKIPNGDRETEKRLKSYKKRVNFVRYAIQK